MGMDDKVLSHIRRMANGVVASFNEKNVWGVAVETRRRETDVEICVTLRPGTTAPAEPLLELGDIADAIRNELRLERNKIGQQVFGTSESTFETEGRPNFTFHVWEL